jgi:hypothetical protein
VLVTILTPIPAAVFPLPFPPNIRTTLGGIIKSSQRESVSLTTAGVIRNSGEGQGYLTGGGEENTILVEKSLEWAEKEPIFEQSLIK